MLKNCLFLLKYPIMQILALGQIWNFQISSKNSFITPATGTTVIYGYIMELFSKRRWKLVSAL